MEYTNFASKGIANAGLTTGIIGTTLGVLNGNGGNGLLGGLFGNNCCANGMQANCTENVLVNRYELAQEQKISELQSQIALRDANTYMDGKMLEMYKYVDGRFNNLESQICQQAVYNATNNSAMACLQGQVAQLYGLTKLIVPSDNVCPQPMPQYNSWTAPTA